MPGSFGDHEEGEGRYQYEGTVNPHDPSVSNGQITPAQWAQYQSRRRRDAILGSLLTVGGMLGAQPLANVLGIGAAGGGGATLPAAATEGMLPMSVAGGAGGAAGAAGGVGGAAGGAGGIFGGLSARDLAGLGLGAAGTIGGALSDRPNYSPNSMATDPQMKEILDMMMGRLKKSEPLHDSVLSMANGLLPTQYQRGGGGGG